MAASRFEDRPSEEPQPSSEDASELVRIAVLVTKAERQRLKIAAAQRGITISEVVRDGIARFLKTLPQ